MKLLFTHREGYEAGINQDGKGQANDGVLASIKDGGRGLWDMYIEALRERPVLVKVRKKYVTTTSICMLNHIHTYFVLTATNNILVK